MHKHVVFKIIKQKSIPIEFEKNEFPVHEHYLTESQETFVTYKFRPDKSLDEERYIKHIQKHLKREYNAFKIEVGVIVEENKISK